MAAAPSEIEARWRALAEATLKGASFEERLVGRTDDGLRIEPVYTRAGAADAIAAAGGVGAPPFVRGVARDPAAPWVIAQRIDLADPAAANAQALEDLENGASGLVVEVGARGVELVSAADCDRLFAGVLGGLVQVSLDGEDRERVCGLLAGWAERTGAAGWRWSPALDPVSLYAKGQAGRPAPARLRELAERWAGAGFAGPVVLVDSRVWHEAGAGEAQELGFALAAAVETLRVYETAGADEALARRIGFKLALDADQFMGLAKIRAARLLWARATEAIGLAPQLAEVRVETSRRMLTRRDPWVNLLRGTVACFAGAAGGADEIALHPFTAALGVPDGFARRLARNSQSILLEESGLGRVADPAGGSAYVESLTQALAAAAWEVFRDVERRGGLLAAVETGGPQSAIAAARERRERAIATRERAITGVSEFPLLGEGAVPVLEPRAAAAEGSGALDPARLAAPFESLRDAAERATEPPRVFLAALGAPAETAARTSFAKGFLEAGGVEAVPGAPVATIAELAAAFAASGARAACLCSSDQRTAADGPAAARSLRDAGASLVMIAGNPGPARDVFTAAGIDLFVHAGLDVVQTLLEVHRRLGV